MNRLAKVAVSLAVVGIVGCKTEPGAARPSARISSTTQTSDVATTQQGASTQPADTSPPVARVNGRAITLAQLEKPLIESYGLNVLLNLVQLELAKQGAEKAGAKVTPDDVNAERTRMLEGMFPNAQPNEYDSLLDQLLARERLSRPEFEIVVETNAYLRKLAEPEIVGKVTEDELRQAFGMLYGENVRVRHIRLANLQEVAEAKRRLAEGDDFALVARTMSRDPRTAAVGGEMPPFSRQSPEPSAGFKEAAFSLKPGEVSDPVQAGGAYHLIKLEQRIAPRAVKFEDVKDAVQREYEANWLQAKIRELRQQISQTAIQSLEIQYPVLKQQFAARMAAQQQPPVRDEKQIREQLQRDRGGQGGATTGEFNAATQPQPKAGDEPPATKPGN